MRAQARAQYYKEATFKLVCRYLIIAVITTYEVALQTMLYGKDKH